MSTNQKVQAVSADYHKESGLIAVVVQPMDIEIFMQSTTPIQGLCVLQQVLDRAYKAGFDAGKLASKPGKANPAH